MQQVDSMAINSMSIRVVRLRIIQGSNLNNPIHIFFEHLVSYKLYENIHMIKSSRAAHSQCRSVTVNL